MILSILIVNWNTRDLLAQCLDSIIANPPACEYEIIVVDNASADGSVAMVRRRFPQVVLIENSNNAGFTQANNQAIDASGGQYFLLLNSDTVALPSTFNPLLAMMESNPNVGAVGPMLLNPDRTFQASYADFPALINELLALFGLAKRFWGPHYPSFDLASSQQSRAVDWVGGACLLVRKSCIDHVGLLDESIVMYGEEVDWCYRMKEMGWQVMYCAESNVIHFGGQSSVTIPTRKYLLIQRGRVTFFRKHRSRMATEILIFMIRCSNLMKAIASFVQRGHEKQSKNRREAYLAAMKTRY